MPELCERLPTVVGVDISHLVDQCIHAECVRGLSRRSVAELRHHLGSFAAFVVEHSVASLDGITPLLIKDFLLDANPAGSASVGKAMVWTLRKFGAFLALRQLLPDNPAKGIGHPKARPREKLPEYLKAGRLRVLMESAALTHSLQDLTVLALLSTTGARPVEIARLRLKDVFVEQQFIFFHVKGGWYKRTPISEAMAETLRDYLLEDAPPGPALFTNNWGRPIDRSWIERLVRTAGMEVGIRRLTPRILRHTFATYLADRHGTPVTRALLGHCQRSHSTEVYMHLIPSKFRVLMNRHPYQTTWRKGRSC